MSWAVRPAVIGEVSMGINMTKAEDHVFVATPADLRLAALRRFGISITVLNLFGHTVLGFEQSWAQLVAAVATALGLELLLEWIQAHSDRRAVRFAGGFRMLVDFLLPAYITGMAVSMLLYAGDRLLPFAFAAAVATGSKAIFVAPIGGVYRHFLNPSNWGLVVAFVVLPDMVAPVVPYQFTAGISSHGDWLLPAFVIGAGSLLNGRLTKRLPLIIAWLGGFVLQAIVLHLLFGTALVPALAVMTGVTFLLFTFYMLPDPGTTPLALSRQVLFGLAVAFTYGTLVAFHVVYGLFFALALVCVARGVGLYAAWYLHGRSSGRRRLLAYRVDMIRDS